LSDLAFLLQRHAIDWPWFWQRTGHHGHTRGALLLLKMVERYFGKQPIDWYAEVRMDDGTVDAMIDEASLLTLRDISSKMDFNLEVNVLSHSTTRGKLGFFFKKVFPLKKEMATFYPVAENSLQIYLWYPIRWWHIVTMRLPEFLARKKTDHMGNEVRHIIRLEQWLDEPSPASLEDS
jgi:hypothetical protein